MAEEDLTLRMRAAGAREAEDDVDDVGDAVERTRKKIRRVNTDARRSAVGVGVFTRAIQVMQTRAIIAAVVVGVLAVGIAAATPAILLFAGALTTAGLIAVPVFLLIAGAVGRFTETVDTAGSAAGQLQNVLKNFSRIWKEVVAPGADIALRGAADALVALMPVVKSLSGPLTTFAGFVSDAMISTAQGLNDLSPQLAAFIDEVGPFLTQAGPAVVSLTAFLLKLGTAGIPVLSVLVGWLVDLSDWMNQAVVDVTAFFKSATFSEGVATVFDNVAIAAEYVAAVVEDLAGITAQLYGEIEPLVPLVGAALVGVLVVTAETLDWLNKNFDGVAEVLVPLTAAVLAGVAAWKAFLIIQFVVKQVQAMIYLFKAWRAGTLLLTAAQLGLNTALIANPIGLIVVALAALAAGLYVAYKRSETFRRIIDGAFRWIKQNWPLLVGILTGPFGMATVLIVKNFETLINRVIKTVNSVIGAFNKLPGPDIGKIGLLGDNGANPAIIGANTNARKGQPGVTPMGHLARGGLIRRGGPYEVGERGRETLHLPAGSRVTPHGEMEYVSVPINFVMDSEVVARKVFRVSIKKKSTR